jgi:hypothetical protein
VARWLVDGNNVFGSRPDGWWNNRTRAALALTEQVARWCLGHDDDVVLVFDRPVDDSVLGLAGGNLQVQAAPRRGRNAADDHLVDLALAARDGGETEVTVVSSDRGLARQLPEGVSLMGAGRFRRLVGY